jgi:hypothetical protein
MDDQSGKIESALDNIDWSWSDLPEILEPLIAGIAVAAGTDALSELNLFDAAMLKRMTARATDYANERAAELVGMKWIDGELVENPDAEFSIAETTRTMLRVRLPTRWIGRVERRAGDRIEGCRRLQPGARRDDRPHRDRLADVQGNEGRLAASGVVGGRNGLAPDCCDECQSSTARSSRSTRDSTEGDEPLHPNCRCTETAVLTEDMPDDAEADDPTDRITARCGASSQGTKPMFIPLLKVDAAQRLVYGSFDETPDRAREICDYATAKAPSRNGRTACTRRAAARASATSAASTIRRSRPAC